MAYDFLRKVPLFADLPEADLERLCRRIEEVALAAGATLFEEGAPGERAYIIRDGQIEIVKVSGGREVLLAVRESGDVIGEGALLEEAPRMATARARGDCHLYAIHKAELDELVQTSASAARGMFFTVLARWRATSAMLRQSEKMAQLGTLTAGVAHELNNPAAAVSRGVEQLRSALEDLSAAERALACLSLNGSEEDALKDLAMGLRQRAGRADALDAVERSDREATIEDWLDDRGVADAWALAPALTNLGYEEHELARLSQSFEPNHLQAVVQWLSASFAIQNRLAEVAQGAGRISEIVKALKSYSYLDQAPVQDVDIHEGLENTLVILRHKLKASIKVRRDYAKDLPKIPAWGSELNQVWTNILDNAADALDSVGGGEVTIRTRREDDWVTVELCDTGPGIPAEIVGRIFDPFFTTKPPGKGTGLGLDISYRIVVHKHGGDIKVYSQPGQTCFEVRLPTQSHRPDHSGAVVAPAATPGSRPVAVQGVARVADAELRKILETTKTIAVVGMSERTDRPAHTIPAELKSHGYRVIPVNPRATSVLGEPAYASLADVPDAIAIDTVLLFVRSEDVPPIVDQAIAKRAKVVWMQEGIVHEEAAHRARAAGLTVVMDRCMGRTWHRLMESVL